MRSVKNTKLCWEIAKILSAEIAAELRAKKIKEEDLIQDFEELQK